jgi:hypothetical protein
MRAGPVAAPALLSACTRSTSAAIRCRSGQVSTASAVITIPTMPQIPTTFGSENRSASPPVTNTERPKSTWMPLFITPNARAR